MRFDGSGDVTTPLEIDQSAGSTASFCAWHRSSGSQAGAPGIIDADNGGLDWALREFNGVYRVHTGDSFADTGTNVPTDDWTQVCAVYDDSDIKLYVDGSEEWNLGAEPSYTEDPGTIGIGDEMDGSTTYDGIIDQVRVYDRALSQSEISSFTNNDCNNRQRTIECVNSPELCETEYAPANNYHCSFGKYDDPQNTDYENAPAGSQGTGVCCPRDADAEYDPVQGWQCRESDECGISSGQVCEYNISSSEDAWFASTSDGSSNACNSQVPNLNVDTGEQAVPEDRSQACCYVPKDGKKGFYYKDGNVQVYG
jgi:hypothetical protein